MMLIDHETDHTHDICMQSAPHWQPTTNAINNAKPRSSPACALHRTTSVGTQCNIYNVSSSLHNLSLTLSHWFLVTLYLAVIA